MAPTVEECITLPNGMKMPRLALGTWKVFIIGLSTNLPVISKTLEHIETFNTNCKVVS